MVGIDGVGADGLRDQGALDAAGVDRIAQLLRGLEEGDALGRHIDALAGHVTAFAEMMTARTGSRDLEGWLAAVEADDQSGLRSFATGIRNDMPAVINGLTLDWNSGRVEGTVNKIKMIKRQMYGRAGFDLLRKRVTLHPALPDHKIRGRAI